MHLGTNWGDTSHLQGTFAYPPQIFYSLESQLSPHLSAIPVNRRDPDRNRQIFCLCNKSPKGGARVAGEPGLHQPQQPPADISAALLQQQH